MPKIQIHEGNRSDKRFSFSLGVSNGKFSEGLKRGDGRFITVPEGSTHNAKGVRLIVPGVEGEVHISFHERTGTFCKRILDIVLKNHVVIPCEESAHIFIVSLVEAPA
ncbi:MAG: hypothetical protein HGA67_01760 [Candidatus Yonathbacteria bacterium]|nr:hypothetical protein [Candidatus Yonathbacteria bacterium]